MAFDGQLSEGALAAILNFKRPLLPALQVIFHQIEPSECGFYRRFVLSDGRNMYTVHCTATVQCLEMSANNRKIFVLIVSL